MLSRAMSSTLAINGGKFELSYASSQGYTGVIFNYGNATITGGEFVCNAPYKKWAHPQVVVTGVVDGYSSSTKIMGGSFTNTFKDTVQNIFHGVGKATSDNFEVSGGAFNKSISEATAPMASFPPRKRMAPMASRRAAILPRLVARSTRR